MNIIGYLATGFLQGLLEWLPISSKSQVMIILSNIFGYSSSSAFDYSIFLHTGTVIAAIIYFRKEFKDVLKPKQGLKSFINLDFTELQKFYLISVIFTLIISVPIYFLLRSKLDLMNTFAITLAIGLLLFVTGIIQLIRKKQISNPRPSTKNALLLGISQGFAIIPGISRSGITTSALLFEGFSPEDAFRHSFILSIPTILIGEIGLAVINGFSFSAGMLLAMTIAGIVGYFTIGLLIKATKKINFAYFCFIIGAIYVFISFV